MSLADKIEERIRYVKIKNQDLQDILPGSLIRGIALEAADVARTEFSNQMLDKYGHRITRICLRPWLGHKCPLRETQ